MVTKVQKWGNSQGLRLTKQVLEEARISVGDLVDVSTQDGVISLLPQGAYGANRACQNWCPAFQRITRSRKLNGENLLAERTGK